MFSARRIAPVAVLVAIMVSVAACTSGGNPAADSGAPLSGVGTSGAATSTTATTAVSVPAITDAGQTGATSVSPSSAIPTPVTTTSRIVIVPPVARVTASPGFGTADMSPAQPIVVSVAKGTITKFALTNPDGKVVDGRLSKDRTSWTSGEVLGYGKVYTATGSVMGSDGKTVAIKGTYTTVDPETRVRVNVSPGDGQVVGVAAPVIVRFGMEPTDRALIEKHVKITTTPKVEGSWAWIQHDDGLWAMDWRPRSYWPAGTKVHVEADTYGIIFGAGAYGGDDVSTAFTIGRNQVVYADAKSFHIVVKRNGKPVADYAASYGSGDDIGDPNRVTRSGIHVVGELLPVHKMSNPAYGYVNVTEYWDVRISDNGEFIHQNQGTVGDQGVVNVSHGCINLSAVSAQAYFKSALYGDPVEVTGTSVQLSAADGDLFDWTIPWDKWLKLSAL